MKELNSQIETEWIKTTDRFVAFFDILGFKELVLQSQHNDILIRLSKLKSEVDKFSDFKDLDSVKELGINIDQTRSITFSDSFIFFSKGAEFKDAAKILIDSYLMLKIAFETGLAVKGALSYGKMTVDFDKSLFFGQPIIDSYLLHEELQMLTVILDHKFEFKYESFKRELFTNTILCKYKANLKSGRITHKLIRPDGEQNLDNRIEIVSDFYKSTSGRPRIYIENTLEFFESLKQKPK